MKRLVGTLLSLALLSNALPTAFAQDAESVAPAPSSCAAPAGSLSDAGIAQCEPRKPPASDRVPDVASLKTPESPAFMALGVTPSDIQRPTTPTGLKASLANGFAAGGGLPLLQSYAVEFSPYWLFPHRRVSFERLSKEPWRALYRNISISLASSPRDEKVTSANGTSETVTYGRFSAGARVTLLPGRLSRGAQSCVAYLKDSLESTALEENRAKHEFLLEWERQNRRPDSDRLVKGDVDSTLAVEQNKTLKLGPELEDWFKRRTAAREGFSAEYASHHPILDARGERCLSDIHAHAGLMAETAGAYLLSSPNGRLENFKQTGLQTGTVWLTVGYVFEDVVRDGNELSLMFVDRLQRADGSIGDPNTQVWRNDAGARLAMAFARYGLALEATYRRQIARSGSMEQKDHLYRAGLSFDYRLTSGIWLSATFGKDFGFKEADKPLLALTNLQWNFGLDRGIRPDSKVTQ